MQVNQIGKVTCLFAGIIWLCLDNAQAQLPIRQWRTHYTYAHSYGLVLHQNSLYSRTKHGLLRYDLADARLTPLTPTMGLHTAVPSALFATENILVLGYVDGHVDVLREETIFHLTRLKNSKLQLPKQVHTAFVSQDRLYVGGAFGLLVFDKSTLKLVHNYFELGKGGKQTTVHAGQIWQDSLFLATEEGLIHAALRPESNLLDYRHWQYPASGRGKKVHIVLWQGRLYSLVRTETSSQLLRYAAGRWHIHATLDNPAISFLSPSATGLFLGGKKALYTYQGNNFQKISLPTAQIGHLHTATYVGERLWLSDTVNGLGYLENEQITWLLPTGPQVHLRHQLKSVGEHVYIFHHGPAFPTANEAGGFASFVNQQWQHPQLGNVEVADVVDVCQTPRGNRYIATYTHGVWQQNTSGAVPLQVSSEQAPAAVQATAVACTAAGALLVATHHAQQPLLRYHPDQGWKALPFLDTLSGSFSLLHAQRAGEQVWGILHNGQQQQLVVLAPDTQRLRMVEKNTTFSPISIHDLSLDKEERLWIATSEGLYMLTNSHLSLLPSLPPLNPQRLRIQGHLVLDNTAVYGLATDGAGRMWCSTTQAIWCIDVEKDQITQRFSSNNSPLPTAGPRALSITQAGELFISTSIGTLSYRTNSSTPATDYQQVHIFPNPVYAGFMGVVAISGLPSQSHVRVTTIDGKLIRSLHVHGGTATWDTHNERQQPVPAGIYLIHSIQQHEKSTYSGKIAILR